MKTIVGADELGRMAGISRYAVHRLIEQKKVRPQYTTQYNGVFWTKEQALQLAPTLQDLISPPGRRRKV